MACFYPVPAWRVPGETKLVFSPTFKQEAIGDKLHVPCGQCFGCRTDQAGETATKLRHELRYHERAAFVTLTYADEHLPALGSLQYADVQAAHHRIRKALGPFRFYVAGEYGERTQRAHWHGLYFGVDFERGEPRGKSEAGTVCYESPQLAELWGKGFVTVGDVNDKSIGYVARYCTKKLNGELGEAEYAVYDADGVYLGQRMPPMARMSNRPGMGARFVEDFAPDLLTKGCVVLRGGAEVPMPRYYEKLLLRDPRYAERMDQFKAERTRFDAKRAADNTPERLAVREEVARAKRRNLKRGL